MSPASALCPFCKRTLHHAGALHNCKPAAPRDVPPLFADDEQPPPSRLTLLVFVVWLAAVAGLIVWAVR